MLDTNICSYIIKRRPPEVLRIFESLAGDRLCISVVTLAEMQYGVERSQKKVHNQRIVDEFVRRVQVLGWDEDAAREYGKLRSHLESRGTPIGNMDMLIAAHALGQGCTLVSDNLREFGRVPELKVENWVE